MGSSEETRLPESRSENLRKALGIVERLYVERKLTDQRNQMVLVDPGTGLFVIGNGPDAVQELLELRLERHLLVSHSIQESFVSVPLNLAHIQSMAERMGVVRESAVRVLKVKGTSPQPVKKKSADRKDGRSSRK